MILEFIFRWSHVLFGLVWIGMLYYFNFVQTEYFKEAEASAKADAMEKLAPRALWWFRWGAMFTFITGLYLLHRVGAFNGLVTFACLSFAFLSFSVSPFACLSFCLSVLLLFCPFLSVLLPVFLFF